MSLRWPVSDSILMRVATGEAAAVEECLTRYGGLVWALARRWFPNAADAEDAVQEVFIDLWRSAARFDPSRAAEATFITMIARRRLIDRARQRQRTPNPDAMPGDFQAPTEKDALEVSDEAARVRSRLAELRPEERRVLELTICGGLSQEEAAQATGFPLGTVKTHARRGLIRLKSLVASETVKGGAP